MNSIESRQFVNSIGSVMRLVAGGVGGFLFDGVVLRTRFWINPPLRGLFRWGDAAD
jgi:hypothetical protein